MSFRDTNIIDASKELGEQKMFEINYLEIEPNEEYEKVIYKVLEECFNVEGLAESKFIVSVTLTNPENIQSLNKQYRDIDKPTDVLSFPMFEKAEIDEIVLNKDFENEDVLGDMVISIPRVEEQAKEYGHSFERELSYMVVHSFYHLMGYDHIREEDKAVMRPKEDFILDRLKIVR